MGNFYLRKTKKKKVGQKYTIFYEVSPEDDLVAHVFYVFYWVWADSQAGS